MTTDKKDMMLKVRLFIELECLYDGIGHIKRDIELPFLPVSGMTIFAGVGASWNQLIVEDVGWHCEEQYIECDVRCCMEQGDDFVEFMSKHGWRLL